MLGSGGGIGIGAVHVDCWMIVKPVDSVFYKKVSSTEDQWVTPDEFVLTMYIITFAF